MCISYFIVELGYRLIRLVRREAQQRELKVFILRMFRLLFGRQGVRSSPGELSRGRVLSFVRRGRWKAFEPCMRF